MPTKLVLRNGKLSLRADGRVEKTGDDGACPECGCFACKCSNSALFDNSVTFANLPLKEPCPSQAPDGSLASCIPKQIQIEYPALTPSSFTITAYGTSVVYTPSAIPAISVCMTALSPGGLGPQPFWVGSIQRGFSVRGVAVDATGPNPNSCDCGSLTLWAFVARSVSVTGGSGVSLFVYEFIEISLGFSGDLSILGFASETNLPLDSNFFCTNGTLSVSSNGATTFLPYTLATGLIASGNALVRACAACAAVAADAGNCTASGNAGEDCTNGPTAPPIPHCFYLVTANSTGDYASPAWSAWTWNASDPSSTFIGTSPPPPFVVGSPTIYRTSVDGCRATQWIDGGPAPTDGSNCPGPTPSQYPPALTSSTRCPPPTATTGCDPVACPDGCAEYEFEYAENNPGAGVSAEPADPVACPPAGSSCDTGWQVVAGVAPNRFYQRIITRCAIAPAPTTPDPPP